MGQQRAVAVGLHPPWGGGPHWQSPTVRDKSAFVRMPLCSLPPPAAERKRRREEDEEDGHGLLVSGVLEWEGPGLKP